MRGRTWNKFRAKRCEHDGIKFASMAEGRRYLELRMEEAAGLISDLKLQVKFPLEVCGIKVCTYIADFVYYRDGKEVVEDKKGMRTPVFNLKKKLFEAITGKLITLT